MTTVATMAKEKAGTVNVQQRSGGKLEIVRQVTPLNGGSAAGVKNCMLSVFAENRATPEG